MSTLLNNHKFQLLAIQGVLGSSLQVAIIIIVINVYLQSAALTIECRLKAHFTYKTYSQIYTKVALRYISTQLQQESSATYKVTIIHRHMHAHIHTGGRKQKYPGEKKGVASGKSCV